MSNLVNNPPYPFGFPYYPDQFTSPGGFFFGFDQNPDFPLLYWWTTYRNDGLKLGSFFGDAEGAALHLADLQDTYPQLGITMSAGQTPVDSIPDTEHPVDP